MGRYSGGFSRQFQFGPETARASGPPVRHRRCRSDTTARQLLPCSDDEQGVNRRKPRLAAHQSAPQVSARPPTIGDAMPELAGWDSFYVIIGSSAAALTGLMFVVIALTGEVSATVEAVRAFSTPTVVHFGAVLLLAALLTTPHHTLLTLDRKSTRLNSSHVRISYAVFCLKKKKPNNSFYILVILKFRLLIYTICDGD